MMEIETKESKQSTRKARRSANKTTSNEPELQKSSKQKSQKSSKKDRYESIVLSIMRSVHLSIDLQEVLNNAAKSLKDNIDAVDHVAIFLVEGQEAVMRAYGGHPSWFVKRVSRIPYPKGLTWKTIIERKPIYCDDVDKDTAIGPAGREVGIKSYLSIPISYNDKTIGCINVHSYKKYAFDDEDIRLLNIVTQQIEIAINHAKRAAELKALYEELNERNKGLEILNTITLAVHKFLDIEEVYKTAVDITEVLENVDMTMIYLIDEDRKEAVLKAHRGLPREYIKRASRIPYPKGVTWKVINSCKIINIENAQNDPDIGPAGRKLGHHGIFGIPIMLEDKAIGVVWFCSYKKRMFDTEEAELLTSIGNQIAIAVAKADIYKVLTKKNRYESIISSVLRSIHRSIDLQEVMDNAIEAINQNIKAVQHLGIYIVEGEEAVLRAYKGLPKWFYKKVSRIPYPKGFIWNTIIEGKSRYVPDVDQDNVIGAAGKKFGTKSYLCVPIKSDGETVGVLGIASLIKNAFDQEELKLLETVAHQIETAMNNARQAEELKNLYKELSHRNKDLESLNTINETVHRFYDLEQVYKKALDMTEVIENVDVASIYLVDKQKKEAVLQDQRNLPKVYIQRASKIPYPKGATWKVINSGEILNIEDAQNNPYIGPAGSKLGHHGVLGIPIMFEEESIGVIWFGSYKKRKYDEHEVELLSSIGYQIATAIAKAKLYRGLVLKSRYEAIVSSILRSIHQSIDLQEVLENAVEALSDNIETLDISAIYLVEGKEAVLKSHRGYSAKYLKKATRIPYPKGATWRAIIEDKCRYVPDVSKDKYLGPAGREHGMKSYLSVPIRSHGQAVGTLNLVSYQIDAFDEEEIKLLKTVAQQIEIAIYNARQAEAVINSEEALRNNFEQLSKKNRYEIINSSVLSATHQSVELWEVLDNAVEAMSQNIEQASIVEIYLIEDKKAVLKSHKGYKKSYIKKAASIPYPKGFIWKTAIDEKPLYCPDTEHDKIIGQAGRDAGIKTYLSMPIRYEGKVFGVIGINSFQKNAFDKEELKLLETVAGQIELAVSNTRQAEALRESEQRFRTIADTAPVMIWLSQPDGSKTYFNKVWLEFRGRTMKQELGEGWIEGVHPQDLEKALKIIHPAYEAKEEFKIEVRIKRFDNKYRWILVHGIPRSHSDGSFAGFIGSCVDITEHKEIEERLEDKKRNLLTTINSMANAVITTDTKGSITFINSLAESLTGWENNEAVNKNITRIVKLKDKDKNRLIRIPRQIHSDESEELRLPDHTVIVARSGKETPVYISVSNLKDDQGHLSGSVFILRETSWGDPASTYAQSSETYPQAKPVSLMIAASSIFVLEGVSRILESAPSIDLLASTSKPDEIIPLLLESKPNVLFFDTALHSPEFEEIIDIINEHRLKTNLLLLIQEPEERSVIDAVSLGARGCIVEPSNREHLIQAITAVGNGEIWMGVGLVTQILTGLITREKEEPKLTKTSLTNKEEEIVELVVEGLGNKQISKKLYITEITVKTHLRNIFRKLGIRSRYELVKKFGR